jgi:predicted dehydrogenase
MGRQMTPGVAIVGCGRIGQKRADALGSARIVACADVDIARAAVLARGAPGAVGTADWRQAIDRADVGIVVVSTTNDRLAEVTSFALEAGKHVLVEKPAARSVAEIDSLIEVSARTGGKVRVGFNHRYHPALRRARELFNAGVLGTPMFVRGRYGHGGRIGYEREWRANPVISGGGELIDQGVHLIDLSRWFLGEFEHVTGFAHTYFWRMPVDDNAFMLLRTLSEQVAFLHVSCTEWKNLFSLEIYGTQAKIHVEGLGGSYGVERLSLYRMRPEMGPPEMTSCEYPSADSSWRLEFDEFVEDVRVCREPAVTLRDARAALTIVEELYRQAGYDFASSARTALQ